MKRLSWLPLLGLCFTATLVFAATVTVITQEAVIRKDKRFFAPPITRVPYGSAIEQMGREGDWLRVSYQGKQGWIHISVVQEKKISPLTGEKQRKPPGMKWLWPARVSLLKLKRPSGRKIRR